MPIRKNMDRQCEEDGEYVMAKKPEEREEPFNFGKNAVEKRRVIHSPESLREQLRRLKSACLDLEAYLGVIDAQKITEIQVDGAAKFDGGMKLIDAYLMRVRMGVARTTLGVQQKKK